MRLYLIANLNHANRTDREIREGINVQDILEKNLIPFSYGIPQAVWWWSREETDSSRTIFRYLQEIKPWK